MRFLAYLIFFMLLTLFVAQDAKADYSWTGVKVTCTDTEFKVEEHVLVNEDPEDMIVHIGENSKIYYDEGVFVEECELQTQNVKLKFTHESGKAQGVCGASPTIYLNLSVDGIQVLEKHSFAHGCFGTLSAIYIEEQKFTPPPKWLKPKKPVSERKSYTELIFCGRDGYISNGLSKGWGCSQYYWYWLKERILPLNFKGVFSPYIPQVNNQLKKEG